MAGRYVFEHPDRVRALNLEMMIDGRTSSTGERPGGPRGWVVPWRRPTLANFATVGATLGLALGFVEAALLRYIPRFAGLTQPDVTGAIWIIAPLADAPLGALGGLLLGGIAVLPRCVRPLWQGIWAAIGVGCASAYVGWLLFWFRIGRGVMVPKAFPSLSQTFNLTFTPVLYFAVGFVASALLFRRSWRRAGSFFQGGCRKPRRWLVGLDVAVMVSLGLALLVIRGSGPRPYSSTSASPPGAAGNNAVLIMLDTVRADHLSCYGYARRTTPNLDRLARRGVLFEDAVAPTSWTLPSLASVLTGLLPHQHAADWNQPLDSHPLTLAEILQTRGYATASFNANQDFGLAGWGLDQGFDVYADAHDWLRHNLAATFAGQSLYQTLFREFVSFNEFDHLNAGQINQHVFDWLAHRRGHPYFLFINYVDAHRPYIPPAPYDRRFGRIPKSLLWNISFSLRDGRWSRPISTSDRQDLIDGYDNSLSYLDAQVGRLLETLRTSPDAGRTFVIVAGDHGESFGEHGTYDHGWNLYQEVLRVPLLVAGPGIPAGRRVSGVAELRELFPTVIQFALGRGDPSVEQASLSRFWHTASMPEVEASPVVSEVNRWTRQWRKMAVLSLRDAYWHYIVDASGRTELFDIKADSAEAHDLAPAPEYQAVAQQLRSQLESILARSVSPWRNDDYLAALDQTGESFVRRALTNTAAFRLIGWPVGRCQASFLEQQQAPGTRPTSSQEDLLRSLPYH